MNCELEPFGGCEGRLHHHHIITRSALQGSKEARKYVEQTHPEVLMAYVCAKHHDKLSIAHTKWARAFLMYGKCVLFGADYVSGVLAELRGEFKGPRPELSLEGILQSGRIK